MPTTSYSIKNVVATLDGTQVSGLWDGDDVIMVTQREDVGTMNIGAAGDPLFSQSVDFSVEITLKLQHTSATHILLVQKWKQQREGNLDPFPFVLEDSSDNEGGSAEECYVMKAPDNQKGKIATVREWVLVSGKWDPEEPTGGN